MWTPFDYSIFVAETEPNTEQRKGVVDRMIQDFLYDNDLHDSYILNDIIKDIWRIKNYLYTSNDWHKQEENIKDLIRYCSITGRKKIRMEKR